MSFLSSLLSKDDRLAIEFWRRLQLDYFSADPAEQFASLALSELWPATGRALRKRADPVRFRMEEALLSAPVARAWMYDFTPQFVLNVVLRVRAARNNRAVKARVEQHRALLKEAVVFAPFQSDRLDAALRLLNERGRCSVWSRTRAGRDGETSIGNLSAKKGVDRYLQTGALSRIESHAADLGVNFSGRDRQSLRLHLGTLIRRHADARFQLQVVRPHLVLVHADNHPPHQLYVMAARQLGIRCLMVQHGLDCEIAALDQAYADTVSVWGHQRKERYERLSQNRHVRYVITGNPEFDRRPRVAQLSRHGEHWLWVTRPHSSDKCYLPSRWPDEGAFILRALLAALQNFPGKKLLIKPHPYDTVGLYREILAAPEHRALAGRVELVGGDLWKFIPDAGVVISEDSTAGLEAMLAGKPLVHVHFAASPPAMPFAEWGGAYAATDAATLLDALGRLERMSTSEQAAMESGQSRTLDALAGPADSGAAMRVAALVEQLATEGHTS